MVSIALRVTETPGSCRIHSDESMSMRVPAARTLELLLAAPVWRADGSDTAATAAAATPWGATPW